MAKYGCRHCGGENEVPLSAEAKIEEVGKNLAALIQSKAGASAPAVDLTPVMERLEQLATREDHDEDYCSKHPGQCKHAAPLKEALAELSQWTAGQRHYPLSAEILAEEAESCPHCKAGIEEFIEKEIQKRGMVKPETPAPVTASPATEASVSAPVDDDTPPWRRG